MGKKKATPSPGQLSLFDLDLGAALTEMKPQPGSLNISNQLRSELSEGLRQAGMSRYEAAARMSELVGVEITKSQLDSWTAESKEYHRFPAEYLPAFCQVTGYKEPLRLMAKLVQCFLLESEGALLAELGRIDQLKRDLNRREKAVRGYLLQTRTGQKEIS
jgi:hypothetical protein